MEQQVKMRYERPLTELTKVTNENLMITASPGAGGEWGDDDPIDSKGIVIEKGKIQGNDNFWDD